MNRLLPKSLLGQLLIVLAAGLFVSNAVGWWIYSSDRESAVQEVGGFTVAQRIANLTRLLDEAPSEWRARIVAASSDPTFRLSLSDGRPAIDGQAESSRVSKAIQAFLVARLGLDAARQPIVVTVERPGAPRWQGGAQDHHAEMMRGGGMGGMMEMMHASTSLVALDAAVPLANGQWLLARTQLPEASSIYSRHFILSMLSMAIIVVGVSIWATKRVTAPLANLSAAAQRLGRDVNAPVIPETGSVETREASRAFNEMQARLRENIENRTRLLAAISHDLRTPLTLLRLRAENIPDPDERDKTLGTLGEMDLMLTETLQYARDEIAAEPVRRTDLTALLTSIVDDMADTGLDARMTPAPSILLECRPTALKRAIRNLAENAVKYGKKACVAIAESRTDVAITVEDAGPGLPGQEIFKVMEPFYRIDSSRSRETGGVGLGLAIANSLIQRHRGTLVLENRTEGGLRATIRLPK